MPGSISRALKIGRDGKRLAYVVKDGDFARMVLDGESSERLRSVGEPACSPDGKYFAYDAITESTMSLILDKREVYRGCDLIHNSLSFDDSNGSARGNGRIESAPKNGVQPRVATDPTGAISPRII